MDAFRFLANAAAATYSLPEKGPMRSRLDAMVAPLLLHADEALKELDPSSKDGAGISSGSKSLSDSSFVLSLRKTGEQQVARNLIAVMRTMLDRCESEMRPLMVAHEEISRVGGPASLASGAGSNASGEMDGAAAGATGVEKLPCELCGALVLASAFSDHVLGHGVTLEDGLYSESHSSLSSSSSSSSSLGKKPSVKAPGFGGCRPEITLLAPEEEEHTSSGSRSDGSTSLLRMPSGTVLDCVQSPPGFEEEATTLQQPPALGAAPTSDSTTKAAAAAEEVTKGPEASGAIPQQPKKPSIAGRRIVRAPRPKRP